MAAATNWTGLLVGGMIVLGITAVGVWIISRVRLAAKGTAIQEGFTLGDLRRLRDSGEMSEEEFERARDSMLAAHRRTEAREAAKNDEAAKIAGVDPADLAAMRAESRSPQVKDVET
jgi:hypothetical protein